MNALIDKNVLQPQLSNLNRINIDNQSDDDKSQNESLGQRFMQWARRNSRLKNKLISEVCKKSTTIIFYSEIPRKHK